MPLLSSRRPSSLSHPALAVALGLALALPAEARCLDDNGRELQPPASTDGAAAPMEPRAQMQELIGLAVSRSNAVGAAKLLVEAAQHDIEEAKAAAKLQASAFAGVNYQSNTVWGLAQPAGTQGRVGAQVGSMLYDGGRVDRLTDWRTSLAEAARQGQINTQEQIALQAVSSALERARYRLQAQVYQQYGRKMACLVEALEQIVKTDRGRASELVQAQKSQAQAELARTGALSAMRQSEIRLRRFVGDGLPPTDGLSSLLTRLPAMEEVMAQTERSAEIALLKAQSQAASSYAQALAAATRPQVNWSLGASKAVGVGNPSALQVGINLSLPLLAPAADPSIAAAQRRAEATRLTQIDVLESRRSRVADVHEQATSAFDRARRVAEVVRDSDRVRNFTLQQWQQLGRRSLFDVMAAEGDHYNMRVTYVNALIDGQQANALLWSLGGGLAVWLQ
jgi:outer membrane protein TolC